MSMATSVSNLSPPLPHRLAHQPWHGCMTQPLPAMLPARGSHAPARETRVRITKQRRRCKVAASKGDDSMSSIITELGREQAAKGPRRVDPSVAKRWREIHGSRNWAGLLDPMDPLLRSELIRYGEFAQACYDAYEFDTFSRYSGSCKYIPQHFFANLGMDGYGYEVTRYIYATSNINLPNFFTHSRGPRVWSDRSAWIGYVAVSGDEAAARLGRRDIVVAWRGTVTKLEWLSDLKALPRSVASKGIPSPGNVDVESGFLLLYTDKDSTCRFSKYSAREQVLTEVHKLVRRYVGAGEEVSVTVTGHSLGSALAVLNAYDIAASGHNSGVGPDGKTKAVPLCVFSFSGPRVGDRPFRERFQGALGVKALRVFNVHDVVPKVPPLYSHVGVELALDHTRSPFLSEGSVLPSVTDAANNHNLEAHLHLLDGYHGTGQRFKLASGRDPALVNKGCDFLQDQFGVPPNWRQDENKGMIRNSDGQWVQPERQKIDDHPSDMDQYLSQLGLSKDE